MSRLNLPNDDEDNIEYVKKIINSVGLEFDPNIEIIEFGEMVGATEAAKEENGQVPPELNSLEFFVQALSYFEGEASGKLSSDEQSPASLDTSSNSIIEINAIKTILIQENWESQPQGETTSTPERPPGPSLEEMSYDESMTMQFKKSTSTPERPPGPSLEERSSINAIEVDHDIIGTNSSLTSEYQMSDSNLRWLKQIILSNKTIKEIPKMDKADPNTIIKRKLLKQLPNLQIKKDLIYFVDEDKFKNKRYRYLMPKNEVELTIKELHSKETAGHLGVDKTIEKIKQRFFWINLSRDVKKFIRECFDCQKAKPPKM